MVFVGDICTYTRFECRVESVEGIRANIAFAIFDETGEKYFDSINLKSVPLNRLRVVSSVGESQDILSPTFSDRQERCITTTQQEGVVEIEDDSQVRVISPPTKNDIPEVRRRRSKHTPVRSAKRPSRPTRAVSPSSASSSFSSSSSSPPVQRRRSPKRNAGVRVAGQVTVPIVPDDCSDDWSSEGYSMASSDQDEFSQEREILMRKAEEYEARVGRKRVFRASVTSVASSAFIISDTPDDLSIPKKPVVSHSPFIDRLERLLNTPSAGPVIARIKEVWGLCDSCRDLIEFAGIARMLTSWFELILKPISSPNTVAEIRIAFTDTNFSSHIGWFGGIFLTLTFSQVFKPTLFPVLAEKVAQKIPSHKHDIRLIMFIASVYCGVSPIPGADVQILNYAKWGAETQNIIKQLVLAILENESRLSQAWLMDLLKPVSRLISWFCPPALDCSVSLTEQLQTDPLIDKILNFLARHGDTHFPVLVKCGGFSPDPLEGQRTLTFGKHRGRPFSQVIHDKFYTKFTKSEIKEPRDKDTAGWVDYVCVNDQFCVLGPTSLRAEVEVIRLGKENIRNPENWLRNRAAAAARCLDFYKMIKRPTSYISDLIVYTECVCLMFERIIGWIDSPRADHSLIPLNLTNLAPRAELVDEVYRPLIRLCETFPKYRPAIANGVLVSRAAFAIVSLEQARDELRATRGLVV
jgi:hypothetical protein